jgi:tetratricopeptide (TPR) repeat protein
MIHFLFFALPFYSSDPRSMSVLVFQAIAVASGLVLLKRRKLPDLVRWEVVLLALALLLLIIPAGLSWASSYETLRATTQIRAWGSWLLLAAAIGMGAGKAGWWASWLWLPSLLALYWQSHGGNEWWWGQGQASCAQLALMPSIALCLRLRDGMHIVVQVLCFIAATALSLFLLIHGMSIELLVFLLVLLVASVHQRAVFIMAAIIICWWMAIEPHTWMGQEGPSVPVLARARVQLAVHLPPMPLSRENGYGWSALPAAGGALPGGAGPGHDIILLEQADKSAHPYAVPGAFVWEGIAALGWAFFAALAGFLLLLLVADQEVGETSTAKAARGFLVGLWVLCLFVPQSGPLGSPLWWAMLGLLLASQPRREQTISTTASISIAIPAVLIAAIVLIPLARHLMAFSVYPHPENLTTVKAEAIPRLRKAIKWEPNNGAYRFALALSVFDRNYRNSGRPIQSMDEEVLGELRLSVEKEPYNGIYRWNYSRYLLISGHHETALRQQALAIALAPEKLRYRRRLAETYESLGRLAEALQEFEACADLSPFDPDLRLSIARVLLSMNQPERAAEEYRKVLRLRPDEIRATSFLRDRQNP